MFRKPHRDDLLVLGADEGVTEFASADVLFAMEWSAVAPGIGGWTVAVDNEQQSRLISVIPPGAELPTFFLYRKDDVVVVVWRRPYGDRATMEVGRFPNLRVAVLALCPLHGDVVQTINETMETLYPRSLRRR